MGCTNQLASCVLGATERTVLLVTKALELSPRFGNTDWLSGRLTSGIPELNW